MRPKIMVFDLGKVLVDFDYGIAAANLAPRCAISAGEIRQGMNQVDLLLRYERGQISTPEFFAEFCRLTGYHGTLAEFGPVFGAIFTAIEPMVQLHQKVRARGLPTWIFSNTNELAVEHIRRAFAFFRQFEGYIYSYTEGCMKPEPGMYEALEARSGCAGAEIVYIDDRPENIATAAARGWRGLVHETPVKTIAQVLALVDGPTPGV